eukprot:6390012-Amphidinium_carterae.1
MRSCPIERRPSALLQPPELQVQIWGPGFLASPILATGLHQGRSSQATMVWGRLFPEVPEPGELPVRPLLNLEMTWTHRRVSMQACWRSQVLCTRPVFTTAPFTERNSVIALPATHTAGHILPTEASILVMTEVEFSPTTPFPLREGHWFMPGHSVIAAGRIECQALPWVIIWTTQ